MSVNNAPRGPLGILGDDGGIAQIGAELVARPNGITDADGIDHSTWAFQWTRNGNPITGATGPSYTVTEADTGADIGLRASYIDGDGNQETVIAKPVKVPDPFRDWLDATYWLLFDRGADPVGVRVYGNAYRAGVDIDQLAAFLVADRARGAT